MDTPFSPMAQRHLHACPETWHGSRNRAHGGMATRSGWEFMVLVVRGQKGPSKEQLPLQAWRYRGTDP